MKYMTNLARFFARFTPAAPRRAFENEPVCSFWILHAR